ncbi:MAG: hypothetical protein ACRBBJ_12735 [Rhodomicrobiaceae bacterium]
MKITQIKFWQVLALISGAIITCVMALASISYNATLGTAEPAFPLLTISNRELFSSLALAFDLGMIASVFGFLYWLSRNRVAAFICLPLFIIASLFSIHSVHGYIAINITKSLAPMQRERQVFSSLQLELLDGQNHLQSLRGSLVKLKGQRRIRRRKEIAQQFSSIEEVRARIASSKVVAQITPLAGLEWFLAVTLWFFNATCWTAWFGTSSHISSANSEHTDNDTGDPDRAHNTIGDGVLGWLESYERTDPAHCAQLLKSYKTWCALHGAQHVSDRKFYQRLIELGARKFRDGRNGPTKYQLPQNLYRGVEVKL